MTSILPPPRHVGKGRTVVAATALGPARAVSVRGQVSPVGNVCQ